jgi:hypothetical protein
MTTLVGVTSPDATPCVTCATLDSAPCTKPLQLTTNSITVSVRHKHHRREKKMSWYVMGNDVAEAGENDKGRFSEIYPMTRVIGYILTQPNPAGTTVM